MLETVVAFAAPVGLQLAIVGGGVGVPAAPTAVIAAPAVVVPDTGPQIASAPVAPPVPIYPRKPARH